MRLFAILSIWVIGGLVATSALSATMEQLLVPPASNTAEASTYTPPALTSANFAVDPAPRS